LERGYRPGSEIIIELEVIEDSIRGRVDGQTLFDVRDGRYRRGSIGLFCFAQKGQAFDDVRVERR
ncbi:MAG TPA: hypothetical protein VNO14_16500, partial [Blastocatellia bacterium]|nr:hypothetical protein [Blastocatellia bacterium]